MSTVYCVEDDSNIRELIEYTLLSVGINVESFENASKFFDRTKENKPDLVLLDIMLPDTDGTEILRELRSNPETEDIFAVFITAKSERMDKIRGLDIGADDYITKPFDILELISRVKALLRRCEKKTQNQSIVDHEEIHLDIPKRRVFVDNVEVSLTYKEYELLYMLLSAKGNVVSRDTIISKIWGTDFEGESRTLDVHIRTLRQKLGESGNYIETVRNVGYKIG